MKIFTCRNNYLDFLSSDYIPGWITREDFMICVRLLEFQKQKSVTGDILEIGTYKGRFLPLFRKYILREETLYLCDLFDSVATNLENATEVQNSYEVVREMEITNLLKKSKIHNYRIIKGESSLLRHLPEESYQTFRFIHVDGSHLFESVDGDLDLASKLIRPDYGLVILDDYRAFHAPGVSTALRQKIDSGTLVPIALGPAKAYLAHPWNLFNEELVMEIINNSSPKIKCDVMNDYVLVKPKRNDNVYYRNYFERAFARVSKWLTTKINLQM